MKLSAVGEMILRSSGITVDPAFLKGLRVIPNAVAKDAGYFSSIIPLNPSEDTIFGSLTKGTGSENPGGITPTVPPKPPVPSLPDAPSAKLSSSGSIPASPKVSPCGCLGTR
jgi:hypothetical protein